jgi:hypothetical protein
MRRTRLALALACVAALGSVGGSASAGRGKPGQGHVKFHPDWEKHPSTRHAAMSAPECMAELDKRGIKAVPEKSAPGVLAPVRLPADVGGVVYRTEIAPHLRASNPYDVFDCRLVLSLHELSRVLRAHDIDEVRMFSAWRPPGSKWPEGKLGTRHPGGLAMDAARFGKKLAPGQTTRVWLDVARDFHGAIGKAVCGADAAPPSPATKEASELRSIACEMADQHMFTTILTPNYNRAHFNHFHLEVTPEVRWYLVR